MRWLLSSRMSAGDAQRRTSAAQVIRPQYISFDGEYLPGAPDEITDARPGTNELGGDGQQERHRERSLQARHDAGHAPGRAMVLKNWKAARPKVSAHVQIDVLDRHYAGHEAEDQLLHDLLQNCGHRWVSRV
jgi:hypothetical protein